MEWLYNILFELQAAIQTIRSLVRDFSKAHKESSKVPIESITNQENAPLPNS